MSASDALHEEVGKFKAWAASLLPHQRDCGYDQWQSLWDAAIAVLESIPPDEWSERCRADLILAIARDEVEWIADQLGGKPDSDRPRPSSPTAHDLSHRTIADPSLRSRSGSFQVPARKIALH